MKKTVFFALACALTVLAPIQAIAFSPEAQTVPTGHEAYALLHYLFLETGQANICTAAPASFAEMRGQLAMIPYDRLSSRGQATYDRLSTYLGERKPVAPNFAFSVRPSLSLQLRAITDNNAAVYADYDFLERAQKTQPLFSLPIDLNFTPWLYAGTRLDLRENQHATSLAESLFVNPLEENAWDANMPNYAVLAAGTSFLNVAIGRSALETGRTVTGSMILSDGADRLDWFNLSAFAQPARLTVQAIELDIDRYVYFHDVVFRPLPFLAIRFSEAANVNSTLDLRYFNPLMLYHNYAGWRADYDGEATTEDVGSQMGLAIDVVPLPFFRVYGQFVMNQYQTAYEREHWPTAAGIIPDSIGGMAGLEYARPLGDGYVTANLEGVYANPWLYVLSNHDISYYWSRLELVAKNGLVADPVAGWLGSPFGPDSVAGIFRVGYERPGVFSAALQYRLVGSGSNLADFFTSDDGYYPTTVEEVTATAVSPSGNALWQNAVTVEGNWYVLPCLNLTLSAGYTVVSGSASGSSFDALVGVTWKPF